MKKAALLLPYALGLLVLALIVLDRNRPGSTVYVDANEMARTASTVGEENGPVDPVCKMTVRASGAEKAVYEGKVFHFCSSYCRAAFLEKPGEYVHASAAPRDSHTMRGLPTRLYQWGLALILLVSFGLIELLAAGEIGAMEARVNLGRAPLRRGVKLFPFCRAWSPRSCFCSSSPPAFLATRTLP